MNTGSTGGKTVEVKLSNSDDHIFKVHKVSSADNRNLMGAKFEVKGIDNDFVNSYTTDALGEFTIQGRDLPTGSFEVYEIAAPEGYATDGADIQTFSWDNTRDVTLTFKNAPLPGIQIYKYDKDSKEPLAGATFEIRRDGQVLQTVKIGVNGYAKVYNLPKGFYQVVEVDGDKEHYNLYAPEQTVELIRDQAEIPTLIFQNTIKKHFGIYKIDEEMHKPIQGVTFEIWKDGKLLGNYTADSSGLATVTGLEDGVYVVTEVSCPEGYRLDPEPQNVIVKAGELATVTFENEKLAGVRIKKIDAVTGEGICGVRFLIKDEHNNLIGEYSTDQDGCIELDDLLTDGKSEIKIKVEEIAAAEGYVLDDTVRTLRIRRGETTELVVENTPILGQIQVVKKSAQDNPVTNQPKGSLLEGAVFEITNADTGRVVDTMTSDSRGIAASNPIPLGRYYVQEIQAPRFYQLNSEKVEVKLKVEGDVVRIEMYNDPANINTSIEKTGNYTVDAGSNMRYDFTNIANNSNVPLDNFFWHDRIPTDAVRAGTLTTGTYNARVWYKITYKTNVNDYRTLADNLLSTNRYSFKIDSGSLKLASGEYVTDIRFEFGTVPAGFKMTEKATLLVYVPAYMSGGYNIINRADCGGSYQGEWDNSTSTWVTKIYRAPTYTKPTLPQTGF